MMQRNDLETVEDRSVMNWRTGEPSRLFMNEYIRSFLMSVTFNSHLHQSMMFTNIRQQHDETGAVTASLHDWSFHDNF